LDPADFLDPDAVLDFADVESDAFELFFEPDPFFGSVRFFESDVLDPELFDPGCFAAPLWAPTPLPAVAASL
jgi:hypothetical protein